MKRLSLLVNLTLAVSMVQAQTTPQLVALTGRTPLLVTQTRDCVTKSCRVALPTPLPPVLPYAGGTAYDSVLGQILVSDGFRIIHVDHDTCSTVCGPYQPPITTSSVVTGLAMDEVQKVLWISDSSNTLSKTTGCPATLVSSCRMAMPVGYTVAGLASDDLRGLLFYAAGDWGMTPPRPNLVVVAKTSSPCTPLCTIQVTGCGTNPMNPITGLGFDPITSTLFMTDGRQTLESKFDLQNCTLSEVRCCGGVQPVNEPYVGLEFLPIRATIDDELPVTELHALKALMDRLSLETVDVRVVPDLYQYATLGRGVEEFAGLPIISLQDAPIYGWNSVLKRFFDVLFSMTVLVGLAPVLLLIALIVKLSSKGPVLYLQERMGLDGRVFSMYKFRTMRLDAEHDGQARMADRHDPRRTPIGSFLRTLSLDELPQFVNVLKGDMSVVGPRPERPSFIEDFKHQIPKYHLRHKMKAGVTGWAQIHGLRGQTSIARRIEYDLYYIEHWSLMLDLKIVLRTIFGGFLSKNAY